MLNNKAVLKKLVHDLGAPCRHIKFFSQCLEEDCFDDLGEQGQSHLSMLKKSSLHLEQMVMGLALVSQAQNAQPGAGVSVEEALENAKQSIKSDYPHIKMQISISGDGLTFQLPSGLFVQLFYELFKNSCLYCASESCEIKVSVSLKNDFLEIFVEDNGIGLKDKSQSSRIFEAFFRLHGESECPGVGLGLTFCDELIKSFGGSIKVFEPSDNLKFIIKLPQLAAKA